ncbi:MAG: head decoration protein [Desulfovibrio sp.]|jgi:hypothetical protein|nr:head decoration protein [Desulfovibrio sp.]
MEKIATYQRPAFLKDHPPVTQRIILSSTGTAQTLVAGSVIGHQPYVAPGEGNVPPAVLESIGEWKPTHDRVVGVLAGDVDVPEADGVTATVYVHGAFVRDELIFAEGVTAENEKTAFAAMRGVGLYA